MHRKRLVLAIVGMVLFLVYVQAAPTVMLVPFQTRGFSNYEESILHSLMKVFIQTTESFCVTQHDQVELQLTKLVKKIGTLPETQSVIDIGRRLSADYVLMDRNTKKCRPLYSPKKLC